MARALANMDCYGARFYDPVLGRFGEQDPTVSCLMTRT